jgi:2-polyprenyl-3-methyl-5-hydroxy-6-metoxy-1,4-benzoquinol methylase
MKEIINNHSNGKLISEEAFLKAELEMGIGFHNPAFTNLAAEVAKIVKPLGQSILDYGAGTGVYADAYYKEGMETYVYEIFESHRNYIRQNAPHLIIIDEPITTDVLSWIEVAEHMTDAEINQLFKKIKPTYILFSSTPEHTDWDYEWGHINICSHEEWVKMFKAYGYKLEQNLSHPTPWAKLFKCEF